MKNAFLLWAALCFMRPACGQHILNNGIMPDLVRDLDTTVFKTIMPEKNGFTRAYLVADPGISFITSTKSRMDVPGSVLICVEGNLLNGQRTGLFTSYVIDNVDHNKRYKIDEQDFKNNLIDGHWKSFDLDGNLKFDLLYARGKSRGKSVYYAADGKTVQQTNNFHNDSVFIATGYFEGGIKKQEQTMVNNVPNGPSKVYYPNGKIKSTATFLNGQFNDTLKYYYDNGQLWTEEVFKNGLDWTIISNYNKTGKPQPAGTLTNDNGTRILYNKEGEVVDTVTYLNGKSQ